MIVCVYPNWLEKRMAQHRAWQGLMESQIYGYTPDESLDRMRVVKGNSK